MTRRAIAATVAFLIGWSIFHVVTPVQEVAIPEMPDLEVRSITLKHYGCTDAELKCSVFDVTFRSDGTATYIGYSNDDFIGKHKSLIGEHDFDTLVEQIQKQGFFELPPDYNTEIEEEQIKIEVVTNEGLRVVRFNNWSDTPVELRILDALIEEQIYHMYWDEDK
ncbi:MAG TPA: DUF6438 domain-containing protein [Pyrinomonadaceae bacterium]|nr:DUF6438 domain-containing protein [Pyrinomonadaceae bacterium]